VKAIFERIEAVPHESGVVLKLEDYMKRFDPTYMMLAHSWMGGAEFLALMEDKPQFFGGSVIRTTKRTEEVLRQAARAAREIGETTLELTVLEAAIVIKRDIVFRRVPVPLTE